MLTTQECVIIFGGSVLACVRVESEYNAHMQALRDFANNPRELVNLERASAVLSLALNRSQAYEDPSYSKAVEMLDLHIVRHYNGQKSVFEENEELRTAALHLETDLLKHEAKTVDCLKDQLSSMRAQWNTTLDQLEIERRRVVTLQGSTQFKILTDEVERLNKSNKALLDRINAAQAVWTNIVCAFNHCLNLNKADAPVTTQLESCGTLLRIIADHTENGV